MKKKPNETIAEEVVNEPVKAKVKRTKKNHTFFLYVDGEGFICAGKNGMPVVGWEKPVSFSVRSKASYAAEFFKQIGVADDIALFMNIG